MRGQGEGGSTYMMTMNRVSMMLSTPNAFEGKASAYTEKEPTIPATTVSYVRYRVCLLEPSIGEHVLRGKVHAHQVCRVSVWDYLR